MAQAKKGLGRGLAALIPTDMDFLAEVARGDFSVLAPTGILSDAPPHSPDSTSTSTGASVEDVSRETQPATDPQVLEPELGLGDAGRMQDEEAAQWARASAEQRDLVGAKRDARAAVEWVQPAQIVANPYQPRRTFDEGELSSLRDSIREHGVLQPILVRPIALGWEFSLDGQRTPGVQFQLIAGERRWRASQQAGLAQVPVIVREVSDQQALELAIIENVQRHDISALDAAVAYKRLSREFGLSQESIARRVGKSRPSIANTLRLLDLPPEAQQAIQEGAISEGHGRAILLAPGDAARRATLRAVLRGKLSVRQTEELAGRIARQALKEAQSEAQAVATKPGTSAGRAESEFPTEPSQGISSEISDGLPPRALGSEPLSAGSAGAATPTRSSPQREPEAGTQEISLSDLPDREDTALEESLQRLLSCRVQVKRRRAGGQVVLFASDNDQLDRLLEQLAKSSS